MAVPYMGSAITLISKMDVRYEVLDACTLRLR